MSTESNKIQGGAMIKKGSEAGSFVYKKKLIRRLIEAGEKNVHLLTDPSTTQKELMDVTEEARVCFGIPRQN